MPKHPAGFETGLQKAAEWVHDQKEMFPDKNVGDLVNEASMRFNLSPRDGLALEKSFLKPGE